MDCQASGSDMTFCRFLTRCAKWIGEGPHLDLLEELMHLDFDAGEVEAQKWPEPCSPNWRSESVTSDPFFVEYISILCKDNQGVLYKLLQRSRAN